MDPQTGLGVEVYRSRELTNWSEPTLAAFHIATVRNRFWVRWTTPAFPVLSRMKFVCQLDMNRSA
jgi:hypothetical protein